MKFKPLKFILILVLSFLVSLSVILNSAAKSFLLTQNHPEKSSPMIVVNQVGYLPQQHKLALVVNQPQLENLELVEVETGTIALTIQPKPAQTDSASGDTIQQIDFSAFTEAGQYYWRYGSLQSVPFQIAADAYQPAFVTLLRSYYLQRCGVVLADPVTGIYHPPCHRQDGAAAHSDTVHRAGAPIAATGGWHDAGDYGKYVATTAVTIGRILSLYEQHPTLFWDGQLAIPESGNGRADVLDEMQVGLDWLLRMQRPDGAVYRKLSGQTWPIGLTPDADRQPRLIYGISSPETAKFAAVMAMAARAFASYPDQSQQYQRAAEQAWRFLELHPTMQVSWREGDDSGSGKYLASEIDTEPSLTTDADDRFWAAAELLLTTQDQKFEQTVKTYLDRSDYTLFEWKDPSALGMIDLLQNASVANSLTAKIATKLQHRADQALARVRQSGYRLANDRFIWGSNKIAAEEGITLFYAYQLTNNPVYQTAAIDQLDYLLGRNLFNQTFVSAVGTNFVQHVNHLFARAGNILIPGLLVGGANDLAQDGIAPKGLGIRSYLDDERSYATNEYAIDYNASLICLIGLLQSSTP